MANEMRDRLVELIKQKCCDSECEKNCSKCWFDDDYRLLADHLIENGVGFFPPANMKNKCGSCIYAKPVVAFGSSRCYVNCTNKEHIDRFCHREISTLRQRTHPACKSYKAKDQAEQKLKEMRG